MAPAARSKSSSDAGRCVAPATGIAPHPLQRPFLGPCSGCLELPDLTKLNSLAMQVGLSTGAGHSLRFETSGESSDYELRVYRTGVVATRPGNWHDGFNALVWLKFPRSKSLLNTLHVTALDAAVANKSRGRLRDALTQFDECGVIVAGTSPTLWQAICAHRWHEVFFQQRTALLASTRFIVFGHGSLDSLRAPFVGLCGKALFIETDAQGLAAIDAGDFDALDAALVSRLAIRSGEESVVCSTALLRSCSTSADFQGGLQRWQPLPLLGIPGSTSDNENGEYYLDTRQFRPLPSLRQSMADIG